MPFSKKETVLISFTIVAVLVRLLPHPPNVAPITAVALFAGTHFNRKHWAIITPILTMLFTDIFLGFSMITPFVYLAFVGVTVLGFLLKKMNISSVLLSSLLFFVITNLAVWFMHYPLTAEGFTICFTLAIPFFGYSIVGDLFFSITLIIGYRVALKSLKLA